MSKRDITSESQTSPQTSWYKDALIYELHVRAFYDSNSDGIGDFPGLTQKLGYLQDLGITAIWLLPFYPSPLKDDGYDIADYTDVHPSYGTLRDFKVFLKEAHRRGLKVITELVLNHTSDQHPWFQRARHAKPDHIWRHFYVWSDSPEKYTGTRIIFKDFESSNWSWDPVANAYYWHRFYSHQPDLNYDNPHVRQAILKVVDFWFELGVDGLRLDAVPYLFEREGTTGENLPETHAALRRLRRHIDQLYPNRMLLAEANQWPEDAAAYFGDGDECHMLFHFPLMPRLFIALRMEDRLPILDILEQTPPIPATAQWAVFLRNHDELTLEMVSEEERIYMYRTYAQYPEAKLNLGIRRRLASLLNDHRRQIELMYGLLFSLTGTPVLYYGDEIGMGDNIYLGDRNGVRTPMQWSADRNAGFSQANPQQLYLPLIVDHEYHYESLHVEAQHHNPRSLLNWMRSLIALRKRYKAFGRGSLEFLYPENQKVLACIRRYENERLLIVANLSQFLQHVECDLSAFEGCIPVEVFGRSAFPAIDKRPYRLTVGPHSFHWFALEAPAVAQKHTRTAERQLPLIAVTAGWEDVVRSEARGALEEILPAYLQSTAWFGRKGVLILSTTIVESIAISVHKQSAYITIVRVQYAEGESQLYTLPLAYATGVEAKRLCETAAHAVIAQLRRVGAAHHDEGYLYDPMWSAPFTKALLNATAGRRRWKGQLGVLEPTATPVLRTYQAAARRGLTPATIEVDHNNTSVVYGNRLILKLFRCIDEGLNPDLEIGHFLIEHGFTHTPPVAGALAYKPQRGEPISLAIVQGYIPNQGELWDIMQAALRSYFTRVRGTAPKMPPLCARTLLEFGDSTPPPAVQANLEKCRELAHLLGQRTAEMHLTLASDETTAAFAPMPFTPFYQRALYQSERSLVGRVFVTLHKKLQLLPAEVQEDANRLLTLRERLLQRFQPIARQAISAQRIRCHGDYHLGQVLYTGSDLIIFDFEGQPQQLVSERQLKHSPLRDVANMLWSFQYATYMARIHGREGEASAWQEVKRLAAWANLWYGWSGSAFVRAYLATAGAGAFLPHTRDDLLVLLENFLLATVVANLSKALDTRPRWAWIAIAVLLQLLEAQCERV
jgi:maltose alpha-D-glucosyltransferase / alpha-amylase